jgi:hypothetical protein
MKMYKFSPDKTVFMKQITPVNQGLSVVLHIAAGLYQTG